MLRVDGNNFYGSLILFPLGFLLDFMTYSFPPSSVFPLVRNFFSSLFFLFVQFFFLIFTSSLFILARSLKCMCWIRGFLFWSSKEVKLSIYIFLTLKIPNFDSHPHLLTGGLISLCSFQIISSTLKKKIPYSWFSKCILSSLNICSYWCLANF